MALNCVRFQVLKVSKRNSKRLPRDSLRAKLLNSEHLLHLDQNQKRYGISIFLMLRGRVVGCNIHLS